LSELRLGYGLGDWDSIPDRGNDEMFFLRHCVQSGGSGAHPASYLMDNGSSSPGDKAAGA